MAVNIHSILFRMVWWHRDCNSCSRHCLVEIMYVLIWQKLFICFYDLSPDIMMRASTVDMIDMSNLELVFYFFWSLGSEPIMESRSCTHGRQKLLLQVLLSIAITDWCKSLMEAALGQKGGADVSARSPHSPSSRALANQVEVPLNCAACLRAVLDPA